MALAFRINKPEDIPFVFGVHDILLSILAEELRSNVLFPRELAAEVYTAPFVFLSGRYRRPSDEGGWILFTPMVPWTHEVHLRAHEKLKDLGVRNMTIENSVEKAQASLKHTDDTVCIFTKHGGYPMVDDIGISLDERAVVETCDALGWKIPKGWKERRLEISKEFSTSPIGFVDFVAECNKENNTATKTVGDDQMNDRAGETVNI